jgi:hypothetical protein
MTPGFQQPRFGLPMSIGRPAGDRFSSVQGSILNCANQMTLKMVSIDFEDVTSVRQPDNGICVLARHWLRLGYHTSYCHTMHCAKLRPSCYDTTFYRRATLTNTTITLGKSKRIDRSPCLKLSQLLIIVGSIPDPATQFRSKSSEKSFERFIQMPQDSSLWGSFQSGPLSLSKPTLNAQSNCETVTQSMSFDHFTFQLPLLAFTQEFPCLVPFEKWSRHYKFDV